MSGSNVLNRGTNELDDVSTYPSSPTNVLGGNRGGEAAVTVRP